MISPFPKTWSLISCHHSSIIKGQQPGHQTQAPRWGGWREGQTQNNSSCFAATAISPAGSFCPLHCCHPGHRKALSCYADFFSTWDRPHQPNSNTFFFLDELLIIWIIRFGLLYIWRLKPISCKLLCLGGPQIKWILWLCQGFTCTGHPTAIGVLMTSNCLRGAILSKILRWLQLGCK